MLVKVKSQFPINDMIAYYSRESNPLDEWKARPDKEELIAWFGKMADFSHELLRSLDDADLKQKTSIRNPVAKTKYDALQLSYKHQMWHNGQISMMHRVAKGKESLHDDS